MKVEIRVSETGDWAAVEKQVGDELRRLRPDLTWSQKAIFFLVGTDIALLFTALVWWYVGLWS